MESRTRLGIGIAALVCAGAGFAGGYAAGRARSPGVEAAQAPVAPEAGAKPKAEPGAKSPAPNREDAVRALVADLASPDKARRQAACAGLARWKEPAAVEPLLNVLRSDADADVRYQCAMTLAAFGERVVPQLVEALSSGNPDVRYKAGNALEKVQPRSAVVKGLAAALDAKSVPARQHAVFLLGSLGTREAVPLLARALSDADGSVAAKAGEALAPLAKRHRAAVEAAAEDASLPASARAKLQAILLRTEKPSPAPEEKPAAKPPAPAPAEEKPEAKPADPEEKPPILE